jgi:hypothetical protein
MIMIKRRTTTLPAMLSIMVIACSWTNNPNPGPPADPEAGTAEDCADACDNLERLHCPGWEGSPGTDEEYGTADDVPCTQVCEDLMNADPTLTLYPKCASTADTCEAIEKCFEGSS